MIAYLLSLLVIGVAFSRFYAPYLVWENGEETARRFIAHERSIRMYLAGAFFYGSAIIVQLTALYLILPALILGNMFFNQLLEAVTGVLFIWLGAVVYLLFLRERPRVGLRLRKE